MSADSPSSAPPPATQPGTDSASTAAPVGDPSGIPADASPILFADGVVRRFGRDEVLRGASLSLARGELVALVGRSGSGKSTLLSVLGGLDREYSGQVRVFGQELSTLSDAKISQLRNERIGFVFQSFHLLDHLTALENVLLPNTFAATPLSPAVASERAREALSRVDLADRASALPPTLSGGQKQRVALARALFFRPQLLLCDEPTGNLDVDTGQKIIELFRLLNQREGLTLLLVTHEPRVAAVASRVLRIEGGQVIEAAHRELVPAAGDTAPGANPKDGSPEPARDRT